ncbi:MAG: ferritin-like domain-containing protein [Thermoplasmatota archaeon]
MKRQRSPPKSSASQVEPWITQLNALLSQEHACAIRYATHAAVLKGSYRETVGARFKEIAADEVSHAHELRERIVGLDGTPTMEVRTQDLKQAETLKEMLVINIEEEREAIANYAALLETIPRSNAVLYVAIQGILAAEQEHLEQLRDIAGT